MKTKMGSFLKRGIAVGMMALIGAACAAFGGFVGFVIANRRRKKRPVK